MYESNAHFYEFFDRGLLSIEERAHFITSQLQGASQLLDIGAGTGSLARYIASKGHFVTCIEPSSSMASVFLTKTDQHPELYERISLISENIQELDLTFTFDLAYASNFFFLLQNVSEQERVLRAIYRYLKPGCLFVFNISLNKRIRPDKPLNQIGEKNLGSMKYKHFSSSEQLDVQRRKVTWMFETWCGEKLMNRTTEHFIVFHNSMEEIKTLLNSSQFSLSTKCGSFAGEALDESAENAVFVVRRNF